MSSDVLVTRDEALAELARPLAEAAICSATFVALSVRTTVRKEDCERAFRERESRGGWATHPRTTVAPATELRSAEHGSRLDRSGSHDLDGHGPHRARDEQRYQAYRGWVSEQGIVEVGLATFRRKPVRRERSGGNAPLEKDPAAFDVQTFRYLFVRDVPEGSGALQGFVVTAPALRRLSRPDCGAQGTTGEEGSNGASSASDDASSLTSAEDDEGASISDADHGDHDGVRGETVPWGAAERDVLRFALRHGIRYAPPRPHSHLSLHSGRARGHAGVSDQAERASDRMAMRSVGSDGNITTAADGRLGDWAPLPPSLAQGDGAMLFRMLAEAHVPLIVYDGMYDILSLYDAFHAPLPNTLSAFLFQLDRVLPRVVDVRYLATVPGMSDVGGVSGDAQPIPLRRLYHLAMAGAEFQCRHLLQSIRGGRLFVKHPAACALREQGKRKAGGGGGGGGGGGSSSRAHQAVHDRWNTTLETGETDPDSGSVAGILEAGINDLLSDANESREASQHGGFLFMPSASRGAGALRAADVKAAVGALGAALNGEATVSAFAETAPADHTAVDAHWNMAGAALRAFQVGAAFAHLFEKHGWAATVSRCQGRLPFGERGHVVLLPSEQRPTVRGAGANADSGILTPRTASDSASAGLSPSTSPTHRNSSELSSSLSSASPPAPEAAAMRLTTAPGAASPRSLHDKAGSRQERPLAATMPLGFGPRATAGLQRVSGDSAIDDRLNRFLDIVAPNRLTEESREHVFQAMSAMVKRTLGAQTFVYGSFVGKTYLHPSDLNVGIFLVEGAPTLSSTAAGERGSGSEQISSEEASREPPCSTAWCATLMGALGLEAVRCAAGGGGGGGDRVGEAGIGDGGMAMPGMSLHGDQVLAARRDALRRRRKRRGKHGGSSGSGGAADAAALPGAGATEGMTVRSVTVAPSAAATTAAPSEGADSHQRAPLLESISNLSCYVSRDGGRPTAFVSCVADGYTVRLALNPVEELCRARLYAEVDALIGREHLFLRSLQLLKAWSLYAPRGAASVTAAAVNGGAPLSPLLPPPLLDMMALCLFNLFEATLPTPFQVLLRFFAFYGTELDWSRYGISVWGPVELATGALEPGAAGDAKPLFSEAFLRTFVDEYASCVGGAPRADRNGASRDASAANGTSSSSPSSPSPLPGAGGAAGAPNAAAVQRARQHAASCRHALNVFDVLDARQNVGASYLRHEDECTAVQEALRTAFARCVALREQPTAEQLDALLGAERAVDDALETVREHLGDVLSDTLRGAYAAPAFPMLPSQAGGGGGGGGIERRKATDGGRSLVYEEHEEVDGGAAELGAHRISSRPLEYLMQSGLLHADPNRCFAGQSAPLMVPDAVQLKHNFEYVRFLVHSHVSEIGLLVFLTQTLVTRKTLLIGEIGQALRTTFGGQDWSAILKERFGGLKRFLERHSELFWIDTDHPLNPHIYLRSRPNGPPILPDGREGPRRPAEELKACERAPAVEVSNERQVTERKSNRNVGGTMAEKAHNGHGARSWQTLPSAGRYAADESGTVAPMYPPPPPPPLESAYYGPTNGYGAYAPPMPYVGSYPYADTRSMRPLYSGMRPSPQPPYYEAPPPPPMPPMHPSPPRWEHPPPPSPGRSVRLVGGRGAGGEPSGAPMRTSGGHRPV